MNATKAGDTDDEETADASEPVEDTREATRESDVSPEQYAGLQFTLHLRPADSTAVERCQRRMQRRFDALSGRLAPDALSTERWYKRVSTPTSNDDQRRAVDLFDEFQSAVEEAGGRLTPFFEQRETDSLLGLSGGRVLVFPVACVSVRREGTVVGLYPCWLDGDHYSVGDCLDRLEDGESVTNLT